MRYETYDLETTESLMSFEFLSEGPKGIIKKRVIFQETGQADFYNLAFGDIDSTTDAIDDKIVTDNNDAKKILATIAETVSIFLDKYPNAYIYAKGSTLSRNRLYRIGISNNLEEINEQFMVLGLSSDNKWTIYEKNNDYSAFLIKKK